MPGTREALDLLVGGPIEIAGLLPRASNHTFLASVGSGSDAVAAVYKPAAGEAPLWDFPSGSLAGREVAAYEVAAALGWPNVPPAVLRDGPFGPGAVSLFVETDPREHFFTLRESGLERFLAVAAFDVVVNNADRKGGHCLLGRDGTIWVIDHGLCFHVEPKLRTVIWDFAGESLPAGLAEDLVRVAEDLEGDGGLAGRLSNLISPVEIVATAERAGRLAAEGRFPEPGPGRSVPWPAV